MTPSTVAALIVNPTFYSTPFRADAIYNTVEELRAGFNELLTRINNECVVPTKNQDHAAAEFTQIDHSITVLPDGRFLLVIFVIVKFHLIR